MSPARTGDRSTPADTESADPSRYRWPDAVIATVVTLGAVALLSSLRWLDWASRVDGSGRATFTDGPTRLLVRAAAASIAVSALVAITRWSWLRLVLVAATLVTAGAAVAVALSRIAAANTGRSLGPTVTSYEPGAAIGVLAAFAMVAAATLGLVLSYARTPEPVVPGC